jgi:hypothetical protein
MRLLSIVTRGERLDNRRLRNGIYGASAMALSVYTRVELDRTVVAVRGELSADTLWRLQTAFDVAREAGNPVVVDLCPARVRFLRSRTSAGRPA